MARPIGHGESGRFDEHFRLLAESVRDYAIFLLAPDGTVATWNAGAERFKGYSAAEIVGRSFACFYTAEDLAQAKPARHLELAATTGRFEAEGWRVRRDGSRFWANVVLTALRSEDGDLIGFGKITRDVTERLLATERLREAQASLEERVRERTADLDRANLALRELNEQLEARSRELEQRSREVEDFAYAVAHDFRAPVTVVKGFVDEIERSCHELARIAEPPTLASEARDELVAIVTDALPSTFKFLRSGATRIERMVDSLLALARAGRHEYRWERVDVAAVARASIELAAAAVAERGAKVTVEPMPEAYADATAVGQILSNLIGNAIKYLAPGRAGEVVLGGERLDTARARYWVKDNGVGIPDYAEGRLFQTFARFHPELAPGEGMGLAIVKRAVVRHGGAVGVERHPVGTTFHFSLPAWRPRA